MAFDSVLVVVAKVYFALKGHSFDHQEARILSFAVEFIDERILRGFKMFMQLV